MGCLVLIVLPIVEAFVLWKVGARIGVLATLAALIGSAVLGGALARSEGTRVLRALQEAMAAGRPPERQLIHGLLIFIGGVLFVFPGFVSDAIAVLLVFPLTRALFVALLERRFRHALAAGKVIINFGGFGGPAAPGRRPPRPKDDDIIDVEAEPIEKEPPRLEDDQGKKDPPP